MILDDLVDALAVLIRDYRQGYYQQVNERAAAQAIADYLADPANRAEVLSALDGQRQYPPYPIAGEEWYFPPTRRGQ